MHLTQKHLFLTRSITDFAILRIQQLATMSTYGFVGKIQTYLAVHSRLGRSFISDVENGKKEPLPSFAGNPSRGVPSFRCHNCSAVSTVCFGSHCGTELRVTQFWASLRLPVAPFLC